MDNGFYENISMENPELETDGYMQELKESVTGYFNDFICGRDGEEPGPDASCSAYVSGEECDGVFYCSKMRVEFEYLDEMNSVVNQSIYVDFETGDVVINDDDMGCLYRDNVQEFNLS